MQPVSRQGLGKHHFPVGAMMSRNTGGSCVFYAVTSRNNRGAAISVCGQCQRFITDMENHLLEFRSSKGTAVWPEEKLEDLVCDITCDVVQRYWKCVIQ
jgi:hypothetical protein